MEAIYDDVGAKLGFSKFAPTQTAHGPMFSSRQRLHLGGDSALPPPVKESELE